MAGAFEFVDNSSIEGRSRKLIRSHVMKGKNAGKARPRRRQPAPGDSRLGVPMDMEQLAKTPWGGPKISIHLLSRLCGELSRFSFPCVLTPENGVLVREFMRYINESIYFPECCVQVNAMDTIWFRYLLVDRAYFHCFMAMASVCVGYATKTDATALTGDRRRFALALRCINHKLAGPDSVSDISLAAVMTLCILAAMQEDTSSLVVHFQGLYRMIAMRGGTDALLHNFALVEKAHRYVLGSNSLPCHAADMRSIDIDLALRRGTSTRLMRISRPVKVILPTLCPKLPQLGDGGFLDALQNVNPSVAMEGREMMEMVAVLNYSTTKVTPIDFEDIIISLAYKLIDISPVSARRLVDPLTHAIHLGQLSFMTTFIVQFGCKRRFRYELLAFDYMAALEDESFLRSVDPATHLWLLMVAGIAVLDARDKSWLLPKISAAATRLGIHNWAGVSDLLRRYPWVNSLHDRPAMEFWCLGRDRHLLEPPQRGHEASVEIVPR